jgi:hypothetical protein
MSVLIEGISVVVRRDSIAQKLRGGWNAFTALVPNKTLCTDAELAGVAFMVGSDAIAFISNLEKDGLEYLRDGQAIDIVDVNQFTGVASVCTWLEFYQGNVGGTGPQVAAARLIGGSATPVAIPRNWDFAKSLSANGGFAPDGSPDLKFLRHQNGLDVYLHLRTGKEVYSARANSEQPESQDREWVRTQYERLRLISAEDALDGIPPFPRLPAHLDDQVALNNWSAAWDAWIANEAVQRQRPWLRPMTPQVRAGIVQAERRLRTALADTEQQQELARAKNDLNALEVRLRAQDPAYEAKKAFLLPIVQPLFKQMPPSKWAETFEETYAGVRLPTDSTIPPQAEATSATRSEGDVLLRDAKPQVLDGRITTTSGPECIERDCGTYWLKDIEEWNRAYLEQEMNRWILPDLRRKALNDSITVQQYRDIVAVAWLNAKTLFYALHCNAHAPQDDEKPRLFWLHFELSSFNPGLSFLRRGDKARGFAISKDDLVRAAAHYLKHPEVRTTHFDWLYLDTLVFYEIEAVAEDVFVRGMGTRTNWAAVYARGNEWRYVSLLILFGVLRFAAAYLSGPAVAYWLHRYGHDVAAVWTVGLWGATIIFGWTTYPLRRRLRRKGQTLLTHLLELYRMLGERTISPRKLREKVDAATADGIAFDGAVTAIVDRMVARDPAAFIHLV